VPWEHDELSAAGDIPRREPDSAATKIKNKKMKRGRHVQTPPLDLIGPLTSGCSVVAAAAVPAEATPAAATLFFRLGFV